MLAPAFLNYGPAYFTSKAKPFSALSTAYSNIASTAITSRDYTVVILKNAADWTHRRLAGRSGLMTRADLKMRAPKRSPAPEGIPVP